MIKNKHAQALGRLGGLSKSPAKIAAAKINAKKLKKPVPKLPEDIKND